MSQKTIIKNLKKLMVIYIVSLFIGLALFISGIAIIALGQKAIENNVNRLIIVVIFEFVGIPLFFIFMRFFLLIFRLIKAIEGLRYEVDQQRAINLREDIVLSSKKVIKSLVTQLSQISLYFRKYLANKVEEWTNEQY
ncbi:hypothetical protein [Metamycoplasma neophronis]|uniref:DUF4282 domain-containing protein n=1 Tax=Metamycoplasma neophronis TaxID=872983 RepID=A0ABY2Z2R3_9BACT|nr:hypothetical protein [Metamycoplasma neophronis]TPR54671.1 hypothetical protein FJR74_00145 [Metamycoplasma neophronis]